MYKISKIAKIIAINFSEIIVNKIGFRFEKSFYI